MAHGTRINGTSYGVTGGKCLVGGTGYSIKKGRTLISGTGYEIQFAPELDPTFENNSWENIAWACRNNAVPSTWTVGAIKDAVIDGENNKVRIIGLEQDEYTSGGVAPITFQVEYATTAKYSMNDTSTNEGSYKSTKMHNVYLPSVLSNSDTAIKNNVRQVNKKSYSKYGFDQPVEIVPCYAFLLSTEETMYGKYVDHNEGDCYTYYNNKELIVRARKNLSGSYVNHWSRTPSKNYGSAFYAIGINGGDSDSIAAAKVSVSFAFCF